MNLKIIILFVLMSCLANAQSEPDWNKSAKKDLEKLLSNFKQKKDSLKSEKEKYKEITSKLI